MTSFHAYRSPIYIYIFIYWNCPLFPAVNPLAWANPDNGTNLRLGRPALPPPPFEGPILDPVPRPAKQAKRTSKQLYNNTEMCNQQLVTVKEPGQSRNSSCDLWGCNLHPFLFGDNGRMLVCCIFNSQVCWFCFPEKGESRGWSGISFILSCVIKPYDLKKKQNRKQ